VVADERTSRAQALVTHPSETLDTELKNWIDPSTPHAQSILVKAVLALRNHGGGQILVGFDDTTHQPVPTPVGLDVRLAFHSDTLQALVSRFASQPFEITVEFAERDGQLHPVIFVPAGVRTPVATKSELKDGTKTLVACDTVYVRTLDSNRTPSSARASWKDWEPLMEVCFDNREANIGQFIRRHLTGLTPDGWRGLAETIGLATAPAQPNEVVSLLDAGERRFSQLIEEKQITLPKTGFWSAACVIEGAVPPHRADRDFLQLLAVHNPRYTGWPMWLDSSSFTEKQMRPFVFDSTWQALLVDSKGFRPHIDFQWVDPRGRF
jgi:hypothetical protein